MLHLIDDIGFDLLRVVIWTIPGGSSHERRLTATILKRLLSDTRSRKLIEAGSRNTAPNRRPVSGGISQRRQQAAQRVNEVVIHRFRQSSDELRNFKNQRFLRPSRKATAWQATSLGMTKGKKKMPDVDLANRHPALQSMCSKD